MNILETLSQHICICTKPVIQGPNIASDDSAGHLNKGKKSGTISVTIEGDYRLILNVNGKLTFQFS